MGYNIFYVQFEEKVKIFTKKTSAVFSLQVKHLSENFQILFILTLALYINIHSDTV